MNIHFFTEAGGEMGYGHLSRCSALAEAFAEIGHQCQWHVYMKDDEIEFNNNTFQKSDWLEDPNYFQGNRHIDIAVTDSYKASIGHYNTIQGLAEVAVYFDDTKRMAYPPGIVLNGMPNAMELCSYPQGQDITYLTGPEHQVLRRAFWDTPARQTREHIQKLFITLGGSDTYSLLNKLARHLHGNYPYHLHILAGTEVKMKLEKELVHENKLSIYSDLNALAVRQLMEKCDLAISAGGQSLAEIIATGLPAISIEIAANQHHAIRSWEDMGLIRNAGSADESWAIEERLQSLIEEYGDANQREKISKQQQETIDGKGSMRLARKISAIHMSKKWHIRDANADDELSLYELANDPIARQSSNQSEEIKWDEHIAWFRCKLNDPNYKIYIFEENKDIIAVVRFEKQNSTHCLISINIHPRYRGRGIGTHLLRHAARGIKSEWTEIEHINAEIKSTNQASIKIFTQAGYKKKREKTSIGNLLHYRYDYDKQTI